MSPPLTLPGDIPGLLRLGSVGRCKNLTNTSVSCVVVVVTDTRAIVCFEQTWECYYPDGSALAERFTVERALADIAIDLTDATARVHAAWWLHMRCGANARDFAEYGTPCAARLIRLYPEIDLSDLVPNDPLLLPDGSRRVDAEALRRVCLHVAGRPL